MNTELWHRADGDYLPDYMREVIALRGDMVCFAHRPAPEDSIYVDGKDYQPETYGKGGWNLPDIDWWLDIDAPVSDSETTADKQEEIKRHLDALNELLPTMFFVGESDNRAWARVTKQPNEETLAAVGGMLAAVLNENEQMRDILYAAVGSYALFDPRYKDKLQKIAKTIEEMLDDYDEDNESATD